MTPKNICWIVVLIAGIVACSPVKEKQEKNEVVILQLNDVYEIGPIEGGKVGGLARVATVKKQLESQYEHVITILSGDFLNPSLVGTLTDENGEKIKGRQMVESLNALGLDFVTLGNHEFDLKENELVQRIYESDFIYTCANAFHVANGDTVPFQQIVNGDTVAVSTSEQRSIKFKNGVETNLAFIGNVLPFSKPNYVYYTDQFQAVVDEYNRIKSSANIVLGLTHQSIDEDKKLATMVPEMPLLLGGHEHVNMKHQVGEVTITKADANAKTAYVHKLSIDENGALESFTSELISITDTIQEDDAVKKVVEKWQVIAKNAISKEGFKPEQIVVILPEGEVLDGKESSLRYHPVNFGELTALSMLDVTKSAQVALFNSGSVRLDDELKGEVTEYDVLRSFPYGGGITLVEMTGKVLDEVLEIGTVTNVGLGGYLQVAGIERGANSWMIDGVALNKTSTYQVAITDFLATGKEANLNILKYQKVLNHPSEWSTDLVRNDIRDIFIWKLKETYP